MMNHWSQFLVQQGATLNSLGYADFSFTDLQANETYIMPLQQQGLLEIKGADAAKFLQGQVTLDVRELSNNNSLLGAQCNIKGRMLLCFRALQTDNDRILLRVHNSLITSGIAGLSKYAVFFKIKITDGSSDYCCVGLSGPKAATIVEDYFSLKLPDDGKWQIAGSHIIIRLTEDRYECWLHASESQQVWGKLSKSAQTTSENAWELLNIRAGIGDISDKTLEAFTPQTINYQLVNGINFRKGCYTGQEIVARLHYRGTLKRHMYRYEFDLVDAALPNAGSDIVNASGKSVGEIVSAAYKNATQGELLASVLDDDRMQVYLPNNPQKLSLLALPYAIPNENEAS